MISLRMGLTSGIATSNGSSKPMEIKLQVMHRKGFSLLGWFRESSMAPMCQADLTLWHFECKKRFQIYSAKVGTDHQQSWCSLKVGSMSLWLIIFSNKTLKQVLTRITIWARGSFESVALRGAKSCGYNPLAQKCPSSKAQGFPKVKVLQICQGTKKAGPHKRQCALNLFWIGSSVHTFPWIYDMLLRYCCTPLIHSKWKCRNHPINCWFHLWCS